MRSRSSCSYGERLAWAALLCSELSCSRAWEADSRRPKYAPPIIPAVGKIQCMQRGTDVGENSLGMRTILAMMNLVCCFILINRSGGAGNDQGFEVLRGKIYGLHGKKETRQSWLSYELLLHPEQSLVDGNVHHQVPVESRCTISNLAFDSRLRSNSYAVGIPDLKRVHF